MFDALSHLFDSERELTQKLPLGGSSSFMNEQLFDLEVESLFRDQFMVGVWGSLFGRLISVWVYQTYMILGEIHLACNMFDVLPHSRNLEKWSGVGFLPIWESLWSIVVICWEQMQKVEVL